MDTPEHSPAGAAKLQTGEEKRDFTATHGDNRAGKTRYCRR
jgi:hypothetical protein